MVGVEVVAMAHLLATMGVAEAEVELVMPEVRAYIQDQLLYLQQDKDTTAAHLWVAAIILLQVAVAQAR
jgi:hypothetical protein